MASSVKTREGQGRFSAQEGVRGSHSMSRAPTD